VNKILGEQKRKLTEGARKPIDDKKKSGASSSEQPKWIASEVKKWSANLSGSTSRLQLRSRLDRRLSGV
jgi:hypothetical protein